VCPRRFARLAVICAAAPILATPALAAANTVSYTGKAVKVSAGQTRGLPIYVGFKLAGQDCPLGSHCFDHAGVKKLQAVDWAYPNCLEVLDGSFELKGSHSVSADSPHAFGASGSPEAEPQRQVTFAGRFKPSGKARGWFEVAEVGCSTGHIHWTARPDH
jgi:hypothetical protein